MKILKICGIPIYKILTDDEYVERTRKQLRYCRKLVWIHIAVLLIACVVVPGFIYIMWKLSEYTSDKEQQVILLGLAFGFIFGTFIGKYLYIGFENIMIALNLYEYNRGYKLLIKYYDKLKEIGAIEQDEQQQDLLKVL